MLTNYASVKSTLSLLFFSVCLALSTAGAQQQQHSMAMRGPALLPKAPGEPPEIAEPARQRARLVEGMGQVSFPITTSVPEAQKFFEQGVAQLHGWWHLEAERSFREAATLDPETAMPYWGLAMANSARPEIATKHMKAALLRRYRVSEREQRWLEAYGALYVGSQKPEADRRRDLTNALETICAYYPEDVEARAFLLYHIRDNQRRVAGPVATTLCDMLTGQILAQAPRHPGASHYLLHFGQPEGWPAFKLAAPEAYGLSAPRVPHQWQMTAVGYAQQKNIPAALQSLERAVRLQNSWQIERRQLPDEDPAFAEHYRLLLTGLTQAGRVREAVEIAQYLLALPRGGPQNDRTARTGLNGLLEALLQTERWSDLLALDGTPQLPVQSDLVLEGWRLRALAIAACESGDAKRGDGYLRRMQLLRSKARVARVDGTEAAETKALAQRWKEEDVEREVARVWREGYATLKALDAALAEARLAAAMTRGDRKAIQQEFALLPDLPQERRARVLFALDEKAQALDAARQAAEAAPMSIPAQALLSELRWRAGERAMAATSIETLGRLAAAGADADLPALVRLDAAAADLKLPGTWRSGSAPKAATPVLAGSGKGDAKDGPERWQPYRASTWELVDGDGQKRSLSHYAGRTVLVIFYLGSGCAHCIEQLTEFAPLVKKYAEAGIEIVAVSTDSADGLHKTWEMAKEAPERSFPLVADPALDAFKAYGAYDEFENKALHGAFLVDGAGVVRWHNIGIEPFREPQWLLEESQRLLAQPAARVAQAAR